MKSTSKTLAIIMLMMFSVATVFASGQMETTESNNSANNSSTAAQAAKKGTNSTSVGKLYKELPAGTDGTAGTSAKYVLFGEYPQTIMAEDIIIDKTQSRQSGAFTYYLGSDGEWYYEGGQSCYDYNKFGDGYLGTPFVYSDGSWRDPDAWYYDDDEGWLRETRFFKVEPIKWRVLTENYQGKMLLLPEVILTAGMPFNENERIDKYPNDYETSTIRAFLNGLPLTSLTLSYFGNDDVEEEDDTYVDKGFLQTAFSEAEQKSIAITNVDNSLEQAFELGEEIPEILIEKRELYGLDGTDTQDKIFLLSVNEIAKYTTEEQLDNMDPTDFAYAKGAFMFKSTWLRSPSWLFHNYIEDETEIIFDQIRKVNYGSYKWEYENDDGTIQSGIYSDVVTGDEDYYDDNCVMPVLCVER
jgi:hypothetical protein